MSAPVLGAAAQRRFANLAHAGALTAAEGALVSAEAGRAARGTQVRFHLHLRAGRIEQVAYQAYGCPHTLATCEWLAERLEGQRLQPRLAGEPREWAAALEVPEEKLGRLLIIADALEAALRDGAALGVR